MKAAGTSGFLATQTGPNSLCSMTLWKSQQECKATFDKIRAAGAATSGMKVVATVSGDIVMTIN